MQTKDKTQAIETKLDDLYIYEYSAGMTENL